MRFALLGFLVLCVNGLAFGQQGTLAGKVTDKKTKEGVVGATVLVTGTVQAAPVNLDGSYTLPLAPGTYNITMTYVGYKPLTFPGIVIRPGATTTLDASMEESQTSLGEVTVTGVKQTGTEVALIQDLKKSEVVVSGMSSDQIVKSLDRDAAEVVKRIPGVTIQSNNFIVIRGLAERYNTVMLNDALTPSAETDTRSFSFDILPSAVIDRVLIFKSGSPELPGEMGGGVVKVYTKNSVLENSTSFTASSWYRHGTTGRDFLASTRSRTDLLGFDNGERQLPGSVTEGGSKQFVGLRNSWLPRTITALPDLRLSLGLTRKYELGSAYLSNVVSLSYANTREQYSNLRQRFERQIDPETNQPKVQWNYNDVQATQGVRLGAIYNWQLRLNDRNRFEFRNFLNQYATDEVIHRVGQTLDQGNERDDHALHYQSRTVYSGQVSGLHQLGAADHTTVTWTGGYNYVFRDEPDYSRYRNQRNIPEPGLPARPYTVVIPPGGNPFDASRFFSELRENTFMSSGQWERRFQGRDTTQATQFKLRAGFYAEHKERDFANRFLSYVKDNDRTFDVDETLPVEQLFAPQNIRPGTGFALAEGTQGRDSYNGRNTLLAGYVGVVAPISYRFSISGGLRAEYNRRRVQLGEANLAPSVENRLIPMPSVNATYNFNDRSLLRLASSVTVNRPEFREVAETSYFDFGSNAIITGNADLRTATIYNADLRYEFYPTRSELISIGAFYKYFVNAIEQTTQSVSTEQLYLTFQNAARAEDLGVELEMRKSLVDLSSSRFLQRWSMVANAALVYSNVKLADTDENRGQSLTNRPLQGQSPYVVNVGAFYQDDDHGLQISAQYNVVGQRIRFVGDLQSNYSVIEMPRNVIDLAVTKSVGKHLQIRVGVQDLLNQSNRFFYDFNRDSKIQPNETGSWANYRRGTYSTAGLTWRF